LVDKQKKLIFATENQLQMTKKDKLIQRLCQLPKDFTFAELEAVLFRLGFEKDDKGKTSGSRVRFYNKEKQMQYLAHKPHPSSIIKEKALKDIVNYLTENKLI
jgi:stalled ribosome alternative rescue factor ArfA